MSPEQLTRLALAVVIPGIGAAVAYFVLCRPSGGRDRARAALRAVAVVLIYGLTVVLLIDRPAWPPADAQDWLVYGAPLALLAGLVPVVTGGRGALCAFASALAAVFIARLSAGPGLRGSWSGVETVLHLAAPGLLGAVVAWSVCALSGKSERLAAGALVVGLAGAALTLVLGMSSLMLAQCVGVLAAIAGGTLVAGFLRRGVTLGPGPVAAMGALLAGAVFQGAEFGDAPLARAGLYGGLIALSPAAALGATLGPLGKFSGWRRWAVTLGAAALPILGAVCLSLMTRESTTGY